MYSGLSLVYDRLMADADYPKRTAELLRLFEKYDRKPTLLLDLACGTGGFSNEMAKRGIQVIGVDISPEMLSIAGSRSQELGLEILYLCQNAAELDLYGTVDGAICCMDSLNHITDYSTLCRAIKRVSLFLEPGRLFIFDVNTLYKHKTVLGNNTFVLEENGVYCVWDNEYDPRRHITTASLDFFSEQPDGRYERSGDTVEERYYSPSLLKKAISAAGLEILSVCGEFTDCAPQKNCERAVYITRKV